MTGMVSMVVVVMVMYAVCSCFGGDGGIGEIVFYVSIGTLVLSSLLSFTSPPSPSASSLSPA